MGGWAWRWDLPGLAVLLWPSLRHRPWQVTARCFWAIWLRCLPGRFRWTVGSILSRRARLPVNSFVAAAWQMLAAGAFSTARWGQHWASGRSSI